MKVISMVTPCYNEEENVEAVYSEVRRVFEGLGGYSYEHIFIDNASTDRTVEILKRLAAADKRVKIIVNTRNFGVNRSPLHAILQAAGDAIIPLAADLQDPPGLIVDLVRKWEQGYKIVAAVKRQSAEKWPMSSIRKLYYDLVSFLSETELVKNFTGFGLYDRSVIELIRGTADHSPYFRGLICEIGYDIAQVEYTRPTRRKGFSKNRLYDLYVEAMNGITSQSKLPLRMATFLGFIAAAASLLVAMGYLIYKLIFWKNFSVGMAPAVIGLFFFSSVQLFFLGIIGEYIGAIHGRVLQKWLVIEKERINFD